MVVSDKLSMNVDKANYILFSILKIYVFLISVWMPYLFRDSEGSIIPMSVLMIHSLGRIILTINYGFENVSVDLHNL